jgi:hypothetical protein
VRDRTGEDAGHDDGGDEDATHALRLFHGRARGVRRRVDSRR